MSVSNRVYRRLYRSASDPEELPWSHTDPTDYVSEAINRRAAPGRALDVGCGTGTDTVFLASQAGRLPAWILSPMHWQWHENEQTK